MFFCLFLQISFFGHAPSDVCYLVYSSTTKVFRDSHLEELLNDYFELLTRTIRSLGIHHELFDGQIEDFKAEFHHVSEFFESIFQVLNFNCG